MIPKLCPHIHRPLLWLSVIYLCVASAYIAATPIFEKPDEPGHYGYVLYLREHHKLPPLDDTSKLAGEFKQPPLYYLITTALSAWLPPEPVPELANNIYRNFAAPGYREDNRPTYLHPPNWTPVGIVGRLVSLFFGLGTMICAYTLARAVFSGASVAPLVTATLVGFHPKFFYIATAVSNDALISFLGTLVVTLLVYRVQGKPVPYFAPLMGVLLGLALLAKASGWAFLPLTALGLLLAYYRPKAISLDHKQLPDPAPEASDKRLPAPVSGASIISNNRERIVALLREGFIILGICLLVGGWWYLRNSLLYGDLLTVETHIGETAEHRPLAERLTYDLAITEYTFWSTVVVPLVDPLPLDWLIIWWGRISLAMFAISLLANISKLRENARVLVILLSWPVTFILLVVVYWNARHSWPFGRLLLPALAPFTVLLAWGWQQLFQKPWRQVVLLLSGGIVLLTGTVSPFVSLYPLYHPYRRMQDEQVAYPVGYLYMHAGSDAISDADSTEIAKLIGYNLPQPYAKPGSYTPIELCWRPLGRTEEPYAVFVHLLEASQLSKTTAPAIWGGRRSHPGLGNLPTDRWALDKPFCDRLFVPVFEDTPAPLGTVIEVGFIEEDSGTRLPAYVVEDGVRERVGLPVIGGLAIVSEAGISRDSLPATYTLGSAIALHRVALSEVDAQELRVALTWQARHAVPYDAIIFVHVVDAGGATISQVDRQPLDGRFPTYYWVPGQVLTETFTLSLPVSYQTPLHVNLGMYVWPSMERLPVVDATGEPQPDNLIRLDSPE